MNNIATVSADDAAIAHVVARRALLKLGSDVHGEAFYITAARLLPFYTITQ
jgi:hypothetical protein